MGEFRTLGEFPGELMRRTLLNTLALVALIHFSRISASAQITEAISTNSLLGVTGLAVSIGELSPGTESGGLNAARLRADAELKLKTAGIRVIPEAGWVDSAGGAELYLEVNTLKFGTSQYTYTIELSVIQKVQLSREPSRATLGTTGSTSVMGVVGATKLAASVREQAGIQLDQLIARYQAVNRAAGK
jgi:hypothetical protein